MSARKELNEIQRLVCICVTGAMKTTATAAMEALIALPPVHTIVKAKVFATADRLMQNGVWDGSFDIGHGRIRGEILDQIFDMPTAQRPDEIGNQL